LNSLHMIIEKQIFTLTFILYDAELLAVHLAN